MTNNTINNLLGGWTFSAVCQRAKGNSREGTWEYLVDKFPITPEQASYVVELVWTRWDQGKYKHNPRYNVTSNNNGKNKLEDKPKQLDLVPDPRQSKNWISVLETDYMRVYVHRKFLEHGSENEQPKIVYKIPEETIDELVSLRFFKDNFQGLSGLTPKQIKAVRDLFGL